MIKEKCGRKTILLVLFHAFTVHKVTKRKKKWTIMFSMHIHLAATLTTGFLKTSFSATSGII